MINTPLKCLASTKTCHPSGGGYSGGGYSGGGYSFMHFCRGTMTTDAESNNSDLHRGLGSRLRHTQH